MKHIKLYIIALAISCNMLMVCPFAYADSISDNINSVYDVISLFQSDMTSSDYNTLISYIEDYSSCCLLYNPGNHSFLLNCTNTPGSFGATQSVNFNPIRISGSFFISNNDSSGTVLTAYCDSVGGLYLYTRSGNGSLYQNINSDYKAYYFTTNYILTNDNHSYNMPFANCYHFYTLDFENVIYQSGSSYYLVNNDSSFVENKVISMDSISYSDDDRLKLYKLWSSQNGNSLVVDLSDFRTYTAAAAYNFSNIYLTITCNGVDTEYTLPLTSSTINNGWDNSSNLYTISTPLSDFTLSDTYDTYITKVSFSLDFSSPGGSGSTPFYISTNYPLDVHHSSITPETVPTPVYTDPNVKSDNDISQIVYYLNNTGINYSGDFLMMQGLPDIPIWANRYTDTIFKMSNDSVENAGEFITEPTYNVVTGWTYNTVDIYDYFNSIIGNYSNIYDVFIFPVDYYRSYNEQLSVLYEDLGVQGFIVFFSNRYYNHQNSLNTVDILSVVQKDANNFVDFVEYIQVRLDDFENKSLEILNPLYDETTYIDDKLASILYAVNNIESYNDSSIVTLLTDIKALISSPKNEIDTPQECIQLYEAHPNYFNELWGTPTPALRSASVTPSPNNPYISSDFVRADLIPAWWEGKTLTMVYILKNDGDTSRFYDSILGGLFDAYENLIESDSSFTNYIDSLFKTGYDYTDSFYGHLFDLNYDPEEWEGGFGTSE